MVITRVHMRLSVRGALRWSTSEAKRLMDGFHKDDGSPLASVDELRECLMDELAQGHEFLPLGDCDNFDYKTGCRGHRIEVDDE